MGRRPKNEPEVTTSEYINRLTDDQIYEYIFQELRKNLPDPSKPLILITPGMESKKQKPNAYYATVGNIERVGGCIYQNTNIKYYDIVNGRWMTGGGYDVKLKFTDFDCVNTAPDRYPPHPNETWVDYVNSIVKDKTYMAKAKNYMETKYPQFFEDKRNKSKVYWGGKLHELDEKTSMRI